MHYQSHRPHPDNASNLSEAAGPKSGKTLAYKTKLIAALTTLCSQSKRSISASDMASYFELLPLSSRLELLSAEIPNEPDAIQTASSSFDAVYEQFVNKLMSQDRAVVSWLKQLANRLTGAKGAVQEHRVSERALPGSHLALIQLNQALDDYLKITADYSALLEGAALQSNYEPTVNPSTINRTAREHSLSLRHALAQVAPFINPDQLVPVKRFLPSPPDIDSNRDDLVWASQQGLSTMKEMIEWCFDCSYQTLRDLDPALLTRFDLPQLKDDIYERLESVVKSSQHIPLAREMEFATTSLTHLRKRVGITSCHTKVSYALLSKLSYLIAKAHSAPGTPQIRDNGVFLNVRSPEELGELIERGAQLILCRDQFDTILGFALVWEPKFAHNICGNVLDQYGEFGRIGFISHLCIEREADGVPVRSLLMNATNVHLGLADFIAGCFDKDNIRSQRASFNDGATLFVSSTTCPTVELPATDSTNWSPENGTVFVGALQATGGQNAPGAFGLPLRRQTRKEQLTTSQLLAERTLPGVFGHVVGAGIDGVARSAQYLQYLQNVLQLRNLFESGNLESCLAQIQRGDDQFWRHLALLISPASFSLVDEEVIRKCKDGSASDREVEILREIILASHTCYPPVREKFSKGSKRFRVDQPPRIWYRRERKMRGMSFKKLILRLCTQKLSKNFPKSVRAQDR